MVEFLSLGCIMFLFYIVAVVQDSLTVRDPAYYETDKVIARNLHFGNNTII
jgi:hypothetical protein